MSRSSAPQFTSAHDPLGQSAPDRRRNPRYQLSLPGRFMRADKLDYPCRLKDISVDGAALTTPAILAVGEHVIVYLLHLGGLEGYVVRRFPDGFAMSITATQRKRDKLAGQIRRLIGRNDLSETEERRDPRVPVNKILTLLLPDGTALECPVLDMSRGGASIVTPVRPPIGTEVIFANRQASVVRHHDEGVAVEFFNDGQERQAYFEP